MGIAALLLYEEFQTNVAFSMHPPMDAIDQVFEQTRAGGGVVVISDRSDRDLPGF
jgi:hypothetical protein